MPEFRGEAWHYTSLEAVAGVLESGTLRLSHVQSLNDYQELQHGLDVAADVVLHDFCDTEAGQELARVLSILVDETLYAPTFVGCFSRVGDDVAQWRAYADEGKGCAVKVDFGELMHGVDPEEFDCREVAYESSSQQQIVRQVLAKAMDAIRRGETGRLADDVFGDALYEAFEAAAFLKHQAFASESEVRVVQFFGTVEELASRLPVRIAAVPREDFEAAVGFGISGNRIRTFVQIPVPKPAVKAIMLGPTADERNRRNLRHLGGYDHVEIEYSKAPFLP